MEHPEAIDITETTPPTTLPAASTPWLRRLMALTPNDVLKEAETTWPELKKTAWKFAFLIYRIDREGLYRPHESLTAWARAVLGKKDSGYVSKYRTAAEFVLTLEDPKDQQRAMKTPPATMAEAGIPRLAKKDPEEALKLAESGMSQRELVQAVRVREAVEQHHDIEELRTFKVLLTKSAHRKLLGAWHLVRFQCQTPKPPDSEVADLFATEYLQSVQIEPERLRRIGRVAFSQGYWIADGDRGTTLIQTFPDVEPSDEDLEALGFEYILAGRVMCIDCGVSNPNDLEGNHTFPKSHGGHAGPMVLQCRKDHQAFTEARDVHWKEHVMRWMRRLDLVWFKAAAEHWLDGRRLEGL